MQADPLIVDSLVTLNGDIDSIKDLWRQALQALTDRATVTIHINSSSQEGRSDAGISLASQEEIRAFIAACKEAVRQLESADDDDASQFPEGDLGRGTDRSLRAIRA